MSWDVVIVKSKGGLPSASGNIDGTEMVTLGSAQQVRDAVSRAFPAVDWRDPAHGYYRAEGVSIEFEHCRDCAATSLMLHVRGEADPMRAIAALCKTNGWVAYDAGNDTLLDLEASSSKGWQEFKGYRDSVAAGGASPSTSSNQPPWPLLVFGTIIVAVVGLLEWRRRRLGRQGQFSFLSDSSRFLDERHLIFRLRSGTLPI